MISTDTVQTDWANILRPYPPMLSPRQVQEASQGIIRTGDIYKRNCDGTKRIDLDVRFIGGRLFITKASLISVLSGKKDLPL